MKWGSNSVTHNNLTQSAFFSFASVHAPAGEKKPGQRGGEVSGDQRGRPADWQPAVDDQEHNRREAEPPVL